MYRYKTVTYDKKNKPMKNEKMIHENKIQVYTGNNDENESKKFSTSLCSSANEKMNEDTNSLLTMLNHLTHTNISEKSFQDNLNELKNIKDKKNMKTEEKLMKKLKRKKILKISRKNSPNFINNKRFKFKNKNEDDMSSFLSVNSNTLNSNSNSSNYINDDKNNKKKYLKSSKSINSISDEKSIHDMLDEGTYIYVLTYTV